MSRIIRVYRAALRLYPRSFRDEFADEMVETFGQRLQDSESRLARIAIIMQEGVTLPGSICIAHWHAAQQERFIFIIGRTGMTISMPTQPFRRFGALTLFMWVLYALLVIIPFFAYGIHTLPSTQYGMYDPSGFALYQHNTLLIVAYLVLFVSPVFAIVLSITAAYRLVRYWAWLSVRQRQIGVLLSIGGLSLMTFALTPLGRMMGLWLLD